MVGEGRFALTIENDGHEFASSQGEGEAVLERLLNTLDAVDQLEYFEEIVPDPAYRRKFLECAYKLAPTGADFDELEIRPVWRKNPVVTLGVETRAFIRSGARSQRELAGGLWASRKRAVFKGRQD